MLFLRPLGRFLFVLLVALSLAQAATISFVTPSHASINGNAVNALVIFTTSEDQVTIMIQNRQVETKGDIQNISAVDFKLNTTTPTSPLSITAGSAPLININSSGQATTVGDLVASSRWIVQASTQITGGTEITALGGGKPNQTIIGPPNGETGLYGYNGSIEQHKPFVQTVQNTFATFTVKYPATAPITDLTTVTQVRLTFGTQFAESQELDLVVGTPEPATLYFSVAGIAVFLGLRKIKGRRTGARAPESA